MGRIQLQQWEGYIQQWEGITKNEEIDVKLINLLTR